MIVESNSIEIQTNALGASVDDCVGRGDMAFKFGEITIRMVVKTVTLTPERFRFYARQRYKLVSRFRVELPLRDMDVSI